MMVRGCVGGGGKMFMVMGRETMKKREGERSNREVMKG